MKVTFCGTGAGATYVKDRGGSSVLVEHGGQAILIDCGPGTVRRLWQAKIQLGSIRAILMTHLHYDHAVGLPELFNRFGRLGNDPPLILGPAGIEDYIDACKKLIFVGGHSTLPPHLAAIEGSRATPGKQIKNGEWTFKAIEVPHGEGIPALSWRVESDAPAVVVSGDLKTDASFMVPFARDADLLVHEAYTPKGLDELTANLPTQYARERAKTNFQPTHSEVSEVARIAEKAGVKRLALTHLVPQEDEELLLHAAIDHFSGQALVARPGESVEIV